MSNIKLEFQPDKPCCTKGTLMILNGDGEKPLYSDTLDIANWKKRKLFIKEVIKEYQCISADQLEQTILEQVGQIMAEKRKAEETAEDKPETDPLATTPQEVKDATLEILNPTFSHRLSN